MDYACYIGRIAVETGRAVGRLFGSEMKTLVLLLAALVTYTLAQTFIGTTSGEEIGKELQSNALAGLATLAMLTPIVLLADFLLFAPYRLLGRAQNALTDAVGERDALAQRIKDMEETAPQIEAEIVGPEFFGNRGENRVIQLHFFNRGARSRTAQGATVELSFSREGSEDEPRAMTAHWIDLTTDPNDIGPLNKNTPEMDIPYSHIPRKLPVAVRLENQDFAQVWSSWKYVNTTHARINQGRYLLRAHLKAPSLDCVFWYTLINEGNEFRLEPRPDFTQGVP